MPAYTKEKIIEQFKLVHGSRYDYSLLSYNGDSSKVKIICKEHGVFEQWVSSHKKGSGCKKCFLKSIKVRYTSDEIISQFKSKHGEKYDYSLVEYIHSTLKVKIICRVHGVFEQHVSMHRKGQGCAECMYAGKRHDKEGILRKFNEVHCDRYDYSLVNYVNIDTKIRIICQEHGIFEQSPYHHIQGNNCPKCIGRNKDWCDVFDEIKKVHGDRYDYSISNFEMITKKIQIMCRDHGVFHQTPQDHISGSGCSKCAGVATLTQEEILKSFVKVHGKKYCYSLVDYVGSKHKVKILCKIHGEFEQLPLLHKNGSGCPYCAGVVAYSNCEIIEQFKEIHKDRYDYAKVKYLGIFKKIVITCKEHGDFFQTPKSHKNGSGCPECAITIGHTKTNYIEYCNLYDGKTHLYLIQCFNETENFFKVGISRLGAKQRFDSSLKMPYKFKLIVELFGDASLIWDLEKNIHKLLYKFKYKPKLEFHGKTECFSEISKPIYKLIETFDNDHQLRMIV